MNQLMAAFGLVVSLGDPGSGADQALQQLIAQANFEIIRVVAVDMFVRQLLTDTFRQLLIARGLDPAFRLMSPDEQDRLFTPHPSFLTTYRDLPAPSAR